MARRYPFQPPSGFRGEMLSGQIKLGMTCLSGAPQMVELIGFQGFDFVMIDQEHSDGIGRRELNELIRAADAAGIPALVRVANQSPDLVLQALDAGAIGIIAPHIASATDAAALVRATKYAPEGNRGMCPQIRAARFGGYAAWNEYWPIANEETVVIALIEDPEGMANIDEIAATPGIDAIWIGTADLGQAMGLGFDPGHPDLVAAQVRGQDAARLAGKICLKGLPPTGVTAQMSAAIDSGYSLFMVSCDTQVFSSAVAGIVSDAKRALEQSSTGRSLRAVKGAAVS
jgi:4-hydroxy-2-oxoheptanedioate aldolase